MIHSAENPVPPASLPALLTLRGHTENSPINRERPQSTGAGISELHSRLSAACVKLRTMKPPPNNEKINPEANQRVRESFSRQGLMHHLGAELAALSPGECEIRIPFRKELTQQHGYFHAGVTAAIADSACGYSAYTLMPTDCSVLTVEYKINLVAPADGEALIARARVLRSGKTLKICAADVFAVKGGNETLCATSLSTIMAMYGKSDAPLTKI
jgi:uncharacterized protein (TIGR00369 family)